MENQPKTYQLALGYRQYLLHNAKKLGPFTAPPGLPLICYKQFYGRDDSSKNIFYQDEPDRMNSWEIGSLKPYDFVGQKQVRAYHQKMALQKKKRNLSMSKRTESLMTVSYISSLPSQCEQATYLTKQDLLKMCSPDSRKKTTTQKSQIIIADGSNIKQGMIVKQSKLSRNKRSRDKDAVDARCFSSRKCKENYEKYSRNWKRQKEFRLQTQAKCPATNQTGRSIFEDTLNFRKTIEEQCENSLKELKEHIHPILWMATLHSSKNLQTFYSKMEIPRIQTNSLQVRGEAKLKKELEWVQEKDKQGYVFKANELLAARKKTPDATRCG